MACGPDSNRSCPAPCQPATTRRHGRSRLRDRGASRGRTGCGVTRRVLRSRAARASVSRTCRGPAAMRRGPLGRPPAHQADDRVVGSTTPVDRRRYRGARPQACDHRCDIAETPPRRSVFHRPADRGSAQYGWRNASTGAFQTPALEMNWTLSLIGPGAAGRPRVPRTVVVVTRPRPAGVERERRRALLDQPARRVVDPPDERASLGHVAVFFDPLDVADPDRARPTG